MSAQQGLDNIVERYFDAWRRRDIDALAAVFSPEATYADKPFQDPIKGIDAIKSYWKSEVLTQDHPHISIQAVAYAEDVAFVEWSAQFIRSEIAWEVRGALILQVDRSSGLVHELREYYRTKKTGVGCENSR